MARFEVFIGVYRRYHFMLKTDAGEPLLYSEAFESKADCFDGIERTRRCAGDESRYERTGAMKGAYAFALRDGEATLAMSDMYYTGTEREDAIRLVQQEAAAAKVEDVSR